MLRHVCHSNLGPSDFNNLTLEAQGHFSIKNHSKLSFLLHSSKKTKKSFKKNLIIGSFILLV